MEKIRLYFCDFWKSHTFENDFFVNILKNKYEIVEDSKNPDFIIYSCYGYKHRKYKCPRIFYSGENLTPDFNTCDYAIGFDRLDFGERYLRVPIYYFFDKIRNKPDMPLNPENREFCSFIYSNGVYCNSIRIKFFKLLSEYKKISSAGALLNNTGTKAKDKIEYLKNFKFTIAFENSSSKGYVTEKIYDAFLAHTVPIYWGDPDIAKEFNPEAFINISDYKTLDEAAEKIIQLDKNDELYLKMLNTPYLKDRGFACGLSDKKIIEFFDNIFQNKGKFYRKDFPPCRDKRGRFYLYSKFQRGIFKKIREIILKHRINP